MVSTAFFENREFFSLTSKLFDKCRTESISSSNTKVNETRFADIG